MYSFDDASQVSFIIAVVYLEFMASILLYETRDSNTLKEFF